MNYKRANDYQSNIISSAFHMPDGNIILTNEGGDFFTFEEGKAVFVCTCEDYRGIVMSIEEDMDNNLDKVSFSKKKPMKIVNVIFAILRAVYIILFAYTLYMAQVGDVITIVICIVGLVYSHIRLLDTVSNL